MGAKPGQQLSHREMARAFRDRDGTFDGLFVAAVRTTGVFCRPSCPARRPRPENVVFYGNVDLALGDGFRPCRRCRPAARPGASPEWIQRLWQHVQRCGDRRLSDEDLRGLGIPPSRARRYFRRRFGLTFQQYQRHYRLGRALKQVATGREPSSAACTTARSGRW